jgi:hypothetical protein
VSLTPFDKRLGWKQVTAIDLWAIDPEKIEFSGAVSPVDEAIATAPLLVSIEPTHHNLAAATSQLALDAVERRPEIKDQVIALIVERTRRRLSRALRIHE